MRARLIYNPTAGDAQHSADQLIDALARAGFDVACGRLRKKRRKKMKRWLEEPIDLAVAAGGDGTIAATVRALVGHDVPLAIARLGTANNIAASLGLESPVAEELEGLRDPERRRLDVGIASGAWGERLFVEGAGVGLFQHVLENEASSDDKRADRALRMLRSELRKYRPREWQLTLDGVDRSGEYLLVEVMNMCAIGPGVRLAPSADPFDGRLDVVLLTERDRGALLRYLDARLANDRGARFEAEVERARHVHIGLAGASARLDDEIVPARDEPPSQNLDVRLLPAAIELWLPRARSHVARSRSAAERRA